jgi:hypothetical protein
MVSYGSTSEPGITTDVESALTISTSGEAPTDVGLVGQADLTVGTANPNEVYQITRASKAREYFGEESLLANAVVDALDMGAYPVYAVATVENEVTGEDLSGLTSTSGSFTNAPVIESAADISVLIDGTEKTVNVTYDDPAAMTPNTDEVYVNPVEASFELDTAPSDTDETNDTASYTWYDYEGAIDALAADAGEVIDFLVPISENASVTAYAQSTLATMAGEYNFALGLVGAGTYIDTQSYENAFDDSRMQVVYPTRNASGHSVLGSYAGLRASLGIRTTPINKTLDNQKELAESLNKAQRGSLIDARVVPLADEAAGARVADDVNSVSNDNTEEAGIRYGFSRLVFDFAITTVRINEKPFIGRLNSPAVRNALEGLLNNQLKPLTRSNAIISFSAEVFEVDATTASVELQIDAAEPLRFIENTVTVGA